MKQFFVFFLFSITCFSQTQEAKIFFKDGQSLEGYGMLKHTMTSPFTARTDVRFRLTLKDKPDTWTYEDISRVEFYGDGITKAYEYMMIGDHALEPDFVEVVTEGEVTLYSKIEWTADSGNTVNPMMQPGMTGITNLGANHIEEGTLDFYLKRKFDNKPFAVGTAYKNWMKCAVEYFADCPLLVKKIRAHEFMKSQMNEIVDFYNDICSGEAE